MFSSIITRLFKSNVQDDAIDRVKPRGENQAINSILEHSILDLKGTLVRDFTLFYYEDSLHIDLLIFLPHYGLYFGEKISWKAQDLKGASLERSSKKNKKNSTTHLEVTERILHQKLEDVLSFDSTSIERFFWMEHLCESEFDALHSSFHTLLSKERLIFSDDTAQKIQKKLFSLSTYQENPYSKLKALGSLQAHTLLLPTEKEPFGLFLSDEQQTFLNAPLISASITVLNGDYATGKSSVLIRKVLQALLKDPETKAAIITPTLLSGEILRKEFIAICDFAAVTLDDSRLIFLNPPTPNDTIHLNDLPKNASIILYDDFHLLDATFIHQLNENIQQQSIFISSQIASENEIIYTLKKPYRSPTIKNIQFSHTNKITLFLLTELEELLASETRSSILVVLPSDDLLQEYKKSIDEYLHIECHLLTSSFSLQYKNLEPITLSTPQYLSGVSVTHCYVINLPTVTPEYSMALSRATQSVTVISEDIQKNSISN